MDRPAKSPPSGPSSLQNNDTSPKKTMANSTVPKGSLPKYTFSQFVVTFQALWFIQIPAKAPQAQSHLK